MVFVFEIRGGFHTYMGRCGQRPSGTPLHPAPSRPLLLTD